jgi:hypothetical protein
MVKMTIFDPAMCCSTGVCGPGIDPELLRVATVINTLGNNGIKIERHNLSNNPQAFVDNTVINEILNTDGVEVLPVTIVDGVVVKTKTYPTNDEFVKFLELPEKYLIAKERLSNTGCCKGRSC